MKKVLALAGLLFLAGLTSLNAQSKLGHIDTQALLQAMPERAEAEKKIQDFGKTLENSLKTMNTEYQAKLTAYQSSQGTMTNTERETSETEILQLQQRMQEFQVSAQERIEKQRAELLQPMIDKAKKAIEDVGKENGYTYIFDSSVGVTLYEAGEDVMPKVKAKLGLK